MTRFKQDAGRLAAIGSTGVLVGLGTLAITAAVAATLPSPRPRVGLTSLAVAGLGKAVAFIVWLLAVAAATTREGSA